MRAHKEFAPGAGQLEAEKAKVVDGGAEEEAFLAGRKEKAYAAEAAAAEVGWQRVAADWAAGAQWVRVAVVAECNHELLSISCSHRRRMCT